MLGVYKTLCTLLNMRILLLSKLVAFRSVTKISSCRVNGISSRRETGQRFSFFLFFSLLFCWGGGGGVYVLCSPLEVDGDVAYSEFRSPALSYNPHIHACMHLQRNSTRERSPMDKKIWYSIHLRKFGCDVSVRPNSNRTDPSGGGRETEVSPGGGRRGDYDTAEVRNFAFQAPRSFQG